MHPAPQPVTLNTAAQPITCKDMVWLHVKTLDVWLEAYVGQGKHRPLIGLVKLCRENELRFEIDCDNTPLIEIKRTGRIIRADSAHDVPYIAVSGDQKLD